MAIEWHQPRGIISAINKDSLVRITPRKERKGCRTQEDRIGVTLYPEVCQLMGLVKGDRVIFGFDDIMHIIAMKKDASGALLSHNISDDPANGGSGTLRTTSTAAGWVMKINRTLLTYDHCNITSDGVLVMYPDKP